MQRQAEHFRCKSCITAQPVVCRVRVPALDSADEISWDLMRSDEIKKMRYPVRHDEISDEIGWDLMRSDEISAVLESWLKEVLKSNPHNRESVPSAIADG